MRRRHLIIFAKPPRLGRVKRRLAADIGTMEALRFYRRNLAATLRMLGRDPRWQCWLFLDRGGGRWPRNLPRRLQARGDLGVRMETALRALPQGSIVLIGSDIPGVSRSDIRHAFRGLGRSDVVFGPAEDGGFWLVGLANSRVAPDLFKDIRWSTEHVLADCIRNLARPPTFTAMK
ncbi:MAG: TIGR04282 family arsenosugar biosynthesis glycosyltransferase [Pseudomonadota bacterium]|nr:TIGR04282 family arsenosugar biosynthesis glycosyltransferase [Pseudomonadota bacterium]